MQFTEQKIQGVWVIEPTVHEDPRGYFMEAYKQTEFEKHIGKVNFIQDNESKSAYGVLRGMHSQAGDASQAKLVRVIVGSVLDVVVDARRNSPTLGQYLAVELTAENKKQLFVPHGMYHGFLVLSPEAVFNYKVDNSYQPDTEVALNFADPTVNIHWPIPSEDFLLSPKDKLSPFLKDAYLFE